MRLHAAWSVRPRPESNQEKKNRVRELRVRIVFHPRRFPCNRVTLSLWPKRVHLSPCFSFSHWFRAAAKRLALCYSALLPRRAATLPIADRGKPEKPPSYQKGVMTPNHLFPYKPFFTLEHGSLAPHTRTSSPPYQESGRGRNNNCTQAQWCMNENSPKLVRYVVTHERKNRVRKVLFVLPDTLSSDYVLGCFSQCQAQALSYLSAVH